MTDKTRDSYITLNELSEWFRITRGTVSRLAAAGDFPRDAVIGKRLRKWLTSEVLDWINARIAAREGGAPVEDPAAVRFLNLREVAARVEVSRMTIYRLERDGGFPKAVNISIGRKLWIEAEIADWIDERFGVRRGFGRELYTIIPNGRTRPGLTRPRFI